MKLSIIIPCYNEEETIKPLLSRLFETKFPIEREIIVVDDGSKINHRTVIKEEINSKKVIFIRLTKNHGKGVAIRIGLKYASGDLFVIQDADFEYFPSDIPKLIEPIVKKEVDVVYGSRFYIKPKNMKRFHYFGNIILTKLTNLFYNVNLSDMETGYKVFTTKILKKLNLSAREFEFEPEITAQIILNRHYIKELPIKYNIREFGSAKISLFDGIESALVLLKCRYYYDSKIYHFLFNIYKFHFKKIMKKILVPLSNFFKKQK